MLRCVHIHLRKSLTIITYRQEFARMSSSEDPSSTLSVGENHSDTKSAKHSSPSVSSGNISLSSPVGYIKSCFKSKNGTPRQPSVCSYSRAKLEILKSVFPCPDHSLDGLAQFSHIWILFVFHQNSQESFTKAKVKPPRLDGKKVGVFASRSPHRPNPIGLTLARLDQVKGSTLYLSGMDMIDGTPVLDVKPYVPEYDYPKQSSLLNGKRESSMVDLSEEKRHAKMITVGNVIESVGSDTTFVSQRCVDPLVSGSMERTEGDEDPQSPKEEVSGQCHQRLSASASVSPTDYAKTPDGESAAGSRHRDASGSDVRVADWLCAPPVKRLTVRFTSSAESQLAAFRQEQSKDVGDYKLEFLQDYAEARHAIEEILSADPRSVYRRNGCSDRLYYFTLDNLHITSWFGPGFAEVLHIQPLSHASVPVQSDHSTHQKSSSR